MPAVFIPALLTATTFNELVAVNVFESIVIFSLLYVTGFMINSLTDREIDLKYSSFKRTVGAAAGEIGDRRILGLIALQVGVGLALTADLAARLRNPWLVPLVLVGLFFGLAYSARPFAFKTRGLAAHAIALSISAFTVPFLFLYVAARGSLDAAGFVLISSFTLTAYSLEYANQAYDFTEDLRAGVATPAVRLGLRRSLRLAFGLCAVSLPILAFSLAYLALSRPAVVAAAGDAGRPLVALGAVAAVAGGYFLPLRGLARIARAAKEASNDSAELVATVHKECNYSLWQAAGVTGLASFALAVFLVSASTTGALSAAAAGGFAFGGAPTSSIYGDASLPLADLTGSVVALPSAPAVAAHAVVQVELAQPGSPSPYATAQVPVVLPAPGGSVGFAFRGLPMRPGAETSATLALVIDTNFDGAPDTVAATAQVSLAPPG